MKLNSWSGRFEERLEPAVEFGNIFRCQANVKRDTVLRYRDGIAFARKAIVESLQMHPSLVAEPTVST